MRFNLRHCLVGITVLCVTLALFQRLIWEFPSLFADYNWSLYARMFLLPFYDVAWLLRCEHLIGDVNTDMKVSRHVLSLVACTFGCLCSIAFHIFVPLVVIEGIGKAFDWCSKEKA